MQKIIERLERLIEAGVALKEDSRHLMRYSDVEREALAERRTEWLLSCRTVLSFSGMETFLNQFNEIVKTDNRLSYQYAEFIGLLKSSKLELSQGFLGKLKALLHADMFSSAIEQAQALLTAGHYIPAAVLGRIVIEGWIRDLAELENISDFSTEKASILNEKLKAKGMFSVPKWRQVQSFLDVGNSAAHGRSTDIAPDDVARMLSFARDNCL